MDTTMYQTVYQTMSIASSGEPTLPKVEKRVFQMRDPNNITDIDGAQSAPRYRLFTNKPQFLTTDVEGAVPKPHTRTRNVRDNTLYIDDIEGTRHTIKDRMMRTKRSLNPLDPQYPLPSFAPVEPTETKFIKDPQHIEDIEGARSKSKKEFSTRDVLGIDDIEGVRPGLKHRKLLETIQTRDILSNGDLKTKVPKITDRTERVTDPNNPVYRFQGLEIYDDKYTKPKEPKKFIVDNNLLRTDDIKGALADTRHNDRFERKELKNTNFIGDIPGAHADSIKHSIVTTRNTHPLQPVYQALDPGEKLLPLIPPLIPAELIRVPTLPAVSKATVKNPNNNSQLFSRPVSGGPEFNSNFSTQNFNFTSDFGTKTFGNETGNFSYTGGGKTPPAISRGGSGRNSIQAQRTELVEDTKPGVKTGYLIPVAPLSRKAKAERDADIDLVRSLQ
mmetsp:Transcript_8966/g.9719  ORF Transcript_8966/g.9719 Transcript_8966/m.9719 type:complete len:445 (-) Transcript_8966:109-1443(-)|eukprot:CAMPEP_0173148834 /NCGR_PEP_ID=MMETSP1105-20130129/9962_1 /TAXON_ID=2985 /ORGANISM="Ochromonas sp., Strain BG-1" /LENGTH=444 /DNA_ID=CAMNT_0014063577 /DNA_START=16 /DNA_END=1350 /DNA_ORIENTATION=-